MSENDLLFRRQFLITPDTCSAFDHWQHSSIGYFQIYAHPDIDLTIATSDSSAVTVAIIGYILHPDHPTQSNADIASAIAHRGSSLDSVIDYLQNAAGRFVLVLKTDEDVLVFHDPCGLRSMYYTRYQNKVFIGSQPNLFKAVMPLEKGDRFNLYAQSLHVRKTVEHWIPSGCSLFESVYHLVPNHYLRLSTLEQVRYWPHAKLVRRPCDDVAAEASELLKKLMLAAHHRFDLALSLTAGWDSRMLLSASRDFVNDIDLFTLKYRDLTPASNDIKIPRELLRSLGLHHQVIDCHTSTPPDFLDIYQRNVPFAHDDWGAIAYGMMAGNYPQSKVCIKGNCAGIVKCPYYPYGSHRPITSPNQIINIVKGWHKLPFICEQITDWYEKTAPVAQQNNIDILDLFDWEHRMGSWQHQGQLEWDLVQEVYTPFNHRGLLELMLSAPTRFRSEPNYILYQKMFKLLWPEVMAQPLNPVSRQERLRIARAKMKERLKATLDHVGLAQLTQGARR